MGASVDYSELLDALRQASPGDLGEIVATLPLDSLEPLLAMLSASSPVSVPLTPADQAVELDSSYLVRPHIKYLSDRFAAAVADVEAGQTRRLIVSMPPRHGKQIADREPVLTTRGWVTHGELRVGDHVFSPDGAPVRVRAVSAPSSEKMRVTFTDGSTILAHPAHEWRVYDRARGAWRIMETASIAARSLWTGERDTRGSRAVIQVPNVSPLQMPDADLPVDPYTLGAWLGDGTRGKATICGAEADLDLILAHVPYERGARWVHPVTGVHYQNLRGGLSVALRAAGVYHDKRIPGGYFLASESQRRSLLAGIVDTDGSLDKSGRTRVATVDADLAADVQALVRTLGYRAEVTTRPPDERDRAIRGRRDMYVVAWTQLDGMPSGRALARKAVTKVGTKRRLGIASVEVAPDEPGRCIEVAGGMYLVGHALIPTHNSALTSIYAPVWLLRKHPDWKLMLTSHSPDLAASWGREVRRLIERNAATLGVMLAPDAKAVTRWETTAGGVMRSLSVGQSPTGEGAKVLLVDDPVRNFETAHSTPARNTLWDWWQADISLRLEPPSLTVVTMTRWHEDDLVGRILSRDYPGNPDDWEQIVLPAIAKDDDPIGRAPGDPLLSPLLPDETRAEALERFSSIRETLTLYQWSALFEQEPAPAMGAVFDTSAWRYWTHDPDKATADGRVRYFGPDDLARSHVVSSWDATFKGTETSDYVVGQLWARNGANRFLLDQSRGRRTFTQTIAEMKRFLLDGHGGKLARTHLIEDKANGPAIIDTLRDEVSGIKPVNPQGSKEARARAVTAPIESGNVYLPLTSEAEWVQGLIDEARLFPAGKHDDQVDAMTQALNELRQDGRAAVNVPGSRPGSGGPTAASALSRRSVPLSRANAARAELGRRRG